MSRTNPRTDTGGLQKAKYLKPNTLLGGIYL